MKVVPGFYQKLQNVFVHFGLLLATVDQSDIMWQFFSPNEILDISCEFFPSDLDIYQRLQAIAIDLMFRPVFLVSKGFLVSLATKISAQAIPRFMESRLKVEPCSESFEWSACVCPDIIVQTPVWTWDGSL